MTNERTTAQAAADSIDADLAAVERKLQRAYDATGSNAFWDAQTDIENARRLLQAIMHEDDKAAIQCR